MRGCVVPSEGVMRVSLAAGEGFFGEGARADVRTVWRNAAINAEAHAGYQGEELSNSGREPMKLWRAKL